MEGPFAATAGPSHSSGSKGRRGVQAPCRICLLEPGTLSVFDTIDFNLIMAIKCITGLTILKTDPFTKKICSKCCKFLRDAILFRRKARESFGILQEQYNNSKAGKSKSFTASNNSLAYSDAEPVSVKGEPMNASDVKSEPFESEKVQCKKCLVLVHRPKINAHMAEHNATIRPDGKLECNICGKVMLQRSFKNHLAIKHNIMQDCTKFVCEQCGRVFNHPASYYGHLISHKTEFPFKCNQCDYKGPTESYLKAHMRRHSKNPQHQCSECQAKFTNKCNYTRHMLRHKGKTVKCVECDKYFYTKPEGDKHYEVEHLGVMKYACNICNKPFGYRSAMMKHTLTVHKRPTLGNGRTPSYLQKIINDQ